MHPIGLPKLVRVKLTDFFKVPFEFFFLCRKQVANFAQ